MGLGKKCKTCGRLVDAGARSCPNCGRPIYKPVGCLGCLGLILAAILFAIAYAVNPGMWNSLITGGN